METCEAQHPDVPQFKCKRATGHDKDLRDSGGVHPGTDHATWPDHPLSIKSDPLSQKSGEDHPERVTWPREGD
jgi:hypothetical protein